jgi:hypothetical protein
MKPSLVSAERICFASIDAGILFSLLSRRIASRYGLWMGAVLGQARTTATWSDVSGECRYPSA